MKIQPILERICARRDCSADEMRALIQALMKGELSTAQIAGLLVALRMKGETVTEIATAVEVIREFMLPLEVSGEHLVDIVGTGGDAAKTFNISTASAFVAAAAGATVAKHNNRAISSMSGSADVLAVAGIKPMEDPQAVKNAIEQLGIGFMFAQYHHPSFKHAIAARRELGIRTLFNLLGPLANPASVQQQVIGVYDRHWVKPVAEVCRHLGSQHVMIVHSQDGLDEISVSAPTYVAELNQGEISTYMIKPVDYGVHRAPLSEIQVSSPEQSLELMLQVFDNKPGAALDIVCLNAGAAIYVAGVANSMAEGVVAAQAACASGQASALFLRTQAFAKATQ